MSTRFDSLPLQPAGPVTPAGRLERSADPRQEALARALRPMLGQSLQADVLARLSDGSALVRVAGHAARMPLPSGVPAGSQLAMTLVAIAPRPAFQLDGAGMPQPLLYPEAVPDGPESPSAPVRAFQAASVSTSQHPAGNTPAGPAPDGSVLRLSDTARALAGVLATAIKNPNQHSSIVATAPLLPGPEAQPAQVATALMKAIDTSGLFYEAHVAEWAQGKRALSELLHEPQMQRAQVVPEPAARQAPAGMDPSTAQLVNLQLATQEHASIVWQGQLWPGQHMEWEVRKEESGQPEGGQDDADASWRSGLRVRFPLLGDIAGSVLLEGGRLHIQILAGSEESGALLRRHAPTLGLALEAAGSPLSSLDIRVREDDFHD